MKIKGPKAPTAVHGPLGITYHPNEKVNVIADCLENLWNENYERRLEARVQDLLAAVDNTRLEKVRPCDIQKLATTLKLR
jgi:hypothetical protein